MRSYRALAQAASTPDARVALNDIADEYELMAEQLEPRLAASLIGADGRALRP